MPIAHWNESQIHLLKEPDDGRRVCTHNGLANSHFGAKSMFDVR